MPWLATGLYNKEQYALNVVVIWRAGFRKVHVQPGRQCCLLFHWKSIAGGTRCSTER